MALPPSPQQVHVQRGVVAALSHTVALEVFDGLEVLQILALADVVRPAALELVSVTALAVVEVSILGGVFSSSATGFRPPRVIISLVLSSAMTSPFVDTPGVKSSLWRSVQQRSVVGVNGVRDLGCALWNPRVSAQRLAERPTQGYVRPRSSAP